jgi:hypothetical protein
VGLTVPGPDAGRGDRLRFVRGAALRSLAISVMMLILLLADDASGWVTTAVVIGIVPQVGNVISLSVKISRTDHATRRGRA